MSYSGDDLKQLLAAAQAQIKQLKDAKSNITAKLVEDRTQSLKQAIEQQNSQGIAYQIAQLKLLLTNLRNVTFHNEDRPRQPLQAQLPVDFVKNITQGIEALKKQDQTDEVVNMNLKALNGVLVHITNNQLDQFDINASLEIARDAILAIQQQNAQDTKPTLKSPPVSRAASVTSSQQSSNYGQPLGRVASVVSQNSLGSSAADTVASGYQSPSTPPTRPQSRQGKSPATAQQKFSNLESRINEAIIRLEQNLQSNGFLNKNEKVSYDILIAAQQNFKSLPPHELDDLTRIVTEILNSNPDTPNYSQLPVSRSEIPSNTYGAASSAQGSSAKVSVHEENYNSPSASIRRGSVVSDTQSFGSSAADTIINELTRPSSRRSNVGYQANTPSSPNPDQGSPESQAFQNSLSIRTIISRLTRKKETIISQYKKTYERIGSIKNFFQIAILLLSIPTIICTFAFPPALIILAPLLLAASAVVFIASAIGIGFKTREMIKLNSLEKEAATNKIGDSLEAQELRKEIDSSFRQARTNLVVNVMDMVFSVVSMVSAVFAIQTSIAKSQVDSFANNVNNGTSSPEYLEQMRNAGTPAEAAQIAQAASMKTDAIRNSLEATHTLTKNMTADSFTVTGITNFLGGQRLLDVRLHAQQVLKDAQNKLTTDPNDPEANRIVNEAVKKKSNEATLGFGTRVYYFLGLHKPALARAEYDQILKNNPAMTNGQKRWEWIKTVGVAYVKVWAPILLVGTAVGGSIVGAGLSFGGVGIAACVILAASVGINLLYRAINALIDRVTGKKETESTVVTQTVERKLEQEITIERKVKQDVNVGYSDSLSDRLSVTIPDPQAERGSVSNDGQSRNSFSDSHSYSSSMVPSQAETRNKSRNSFSESHSYSSSMAPSRPGTPTPSEAGSHVSVTVSQTGKSEHGSVTNTVARYEHPVASSPVVAHNRDNPATPKSSRASSASSRSSAASSASYNSSNSSASSNSSYSSSSSASSKSSNSSASSVSSNASKNSQSSTGSKTSSMADTVDGNCPPKSPRKR